MIFFSRWTDSWLRKTSLKTGEITLRMKKTYILYIYYHINIFRTMLNTDYR